MNIEEARRITKLVMEYNAREAEIERIDNRLKYMPDDSISIVIKRDIHVIDNFEISKNELSEILMVMKHRREFLNRNLERELGRYATRYGEDISWDDEDDLK